MPGESLHHIGADGSRRAKEWLDATTRVQASWTVEDDINTSKLSFPWPFGGQEFSFDVGGILSGGDVDKQSFLAESKKYSTPGDQGTHFDDWVAKCYVAREKEPKASEQFMFITWHPFRMNDWKNLPTPGAVKKGLLVPKNRERVFGASVMSDAEAMINTDLVDDVAHRIWIIVLSDKQEKLVISREHRGWLVAKRILEGG